MFKFIKQIFISTIMFFGCLLSVNSLECISMKNQECKIGPEIVNVNSKSLYFILLILKQADVVVFVTVLMIPMHNCVFLMLLKI